MVRLAGLGDRRVDQLSGGQKQRVALARAVVLEPDVLLLDEPMAALDLKLRKQMQVEVKNLQERLKTTFVFVTHDQEEALIMSDRIAVMSQGRIEQLERTEALYERPRTRFVADFLGVKNILEARVEAVASGLALLRLSGGLALRAADDGGYGVGAAVTIGVRPERMEFAEAGAARAELAAVAPPAHGQRVAGDARRRDLPRRPDRLARARGWARADGGRGRGLGPRAPRGERPWSSASRPAAVLRLEP